MKNLKTKSANKDKKHSFIGMHKNKKYWKNKSSADIAERLRKKAWYGY